MYTGKYIGLVKFGKKILQKIKIHSRLANAEIGIEICLLFTFLLLAIFLKKKKVLLWNFGIKIMQLFLYFEDAPKLISQIQIKNTITKIFKI